ncbi:hypothetical protein [uncultured Thermanaerothrix sp.]|uniref:hypothetical protein n=1 Tax=uncultured Thermanaerothrix sp. TaxID=1195149 RepID=UPI0026179C90|nr:hypothetical protein [uncultured Thermanaerothrix sp.]
MLRYHPLQPDPNAQPPAQVRFKSVRVEPWPDGRKVRVLMEIIPFQQPPNIEVSLSDSEGHEITSAHIIENVDYRLVITLHLRSAIPISEYHLTARLTYPDLGTIDEQSLTFVLPPSQET